MGTFYRRPLCLFCFLFMVASLFAVNIGTKAKLILLAVLAAIVFICAVIMIIFKKIRMVLLSFVLCIAAVAGAVANTYFRIDMAQIKANGYEGYRTVEMDIIEKDRSSAYSSSYEVRIKQIDSDRVSVKAYLVFYFATDFSVGDKVFANAELTPDSSSELLLTAVVYEPEDGLVSRFDHSQSFFDTLLSENGARVIVSRMKNWVSDRFDTLIGGSAGDLSKAFLMGDTSSVSTDIIRDFRRTGVSHLFAVSGLHISVLSGFVELLLRRLYVPKALRGMTVSILAFLLLCLAGFSMSAMRSVIMFWIVYLVFLASEENDSPTTLFVAVSIILFVFPYSVYEIGLWMSFLATLGLVTVYPLIESKIPKRRKRKGFKIRVFRMLRSLLLTAVMTVISSLFLLPISWGVFGEMSLVSVPTNILLSPLNAVYLILLTVILAVGSIPFVGTVLAWGIRGVSVAIIETVRFFSTLEGATVSLRYPFAKYLIILFTAVMCVLLTVKLRRKWMLAVPSGILILSFVTCTLVYHATEISSLKYYGSGTSEIISVSDGGDLGVVDMSSGSYMLLSEVIVSAADKGATDVDTLIFTSVTSSHISTMDYLFRSCIIESVYVPMPDDPMSAELAIRLVSLAQECGVRATLYGDGDIIELCNGKSVLVGLADNNGKTAVSLMFGGGERVFGYVDAFVFGSDSDGTVNARLTLCDTVLIGNNGVPDHRYSYTVSTDTKVIYSSAELARMSDIEADVNNCYYNIQEYTELEFLLE